MPVLVANGIADVMARAEHSFAIAQIAQCAKLLLYPDAGHAFLFQYAEDFCAEVLRFTATLAATSIKDTKIENFATGRSSGTRRTQRLNSSSSAAKFATGDVCLWFGDMQFCIGDGIDHHRFQVIAFKGCDFI
jgi:hypothetical protein